LVLICTRAVSGASSVATTPFGIRRFACDGVVSQSRFVRASVYSVSRVRHVQPFSATTASLSSKRTPSIRSTRPADSVISPSNSFGAEARSPNMIRRETAFTAAGPSVL